MTDGTYRIWVKTLEDDLCVWIRDQKGAKITSEIVKGEYVFSFSAQAGEVYYLQTDPNQIWYKGGEFLFSVCFDGYHKTTDEYEVAYEPDCTKTGKKGVSLCDLRVRRKNGGDSQDSACA